MIGGLTTTRVIGALLVGLGLTAGGCRQLNASHCGNQDGDATCVLRDAAAPFCNVCQAANDGCAPEASMEPGCYMGLASSTGDDTTTSTSTSTSDESSSGSSSTEAVDSSSTGEPILCGNGMIDEGEVCDGVLLPEDPPDCSTQGYGMGLPMCHEDCTRLNYMMCPGYVEECGNQEVGAKEECDGTVFGGGMQSCGDFPHLTGDGLECTSECMFDTTDCMVCLEHDEPCVGDALCCEPDEQCTPVLLNGSKCCVRGPLGGCSN